jgi:peroxiredoxin
LREDRLRLEDAGLDVVGVICQKRGRLVPAFASRPFPWPVVVDDDRTIARAWGVHVGIALDSFNIARPASFVVGPDGTVRFAHVSRHQADFAAVDAIVGAAR